jgi:RNA polymerase sigma factor (sigma-70 family)
MMDDDSERQRHCLRITLIERARQGDRWAFDALAAPLRGALLGIAFVRTGDYPEAEDITQQTLSAAWEHIADLRDPASFHAWIRTILARHCATWQRRNRDWTLSLDDSANRELPADNGLQPPNILLRRLRDEELRSAPRGIPEANRNALLMAVWGDCTYHEIAEFTGVSVTTVEGRIQRAKSQLRRALRYKNPDFFGEAGKRWREPPIEET